MNKSYKAASSVGAVALVLSGAVMAAAPAFDNWTVTSGTISSGACATGFSCGAVLSDVGFFQRMVTDTASNLTYFQTIITENNANASNASQLEALTFSDESFVRTGNVNGIADKQRISEVKANTLPVTGSTTFKASTILNSGWAGDSLKLTQHLDDSSDKFQTDFIFAQKGNSDLGSVTAKGMKITAYVPLQGVSGTDKQDFVLVDLQGDYADTVSTTAGGPAPSAGHANVTLLSTTPDQTMDWLVDDTAGANTGAVGNHIKAIYVGQDLTNIVGQVFGFTSYENVTTPQYISAFSLTSMAPESWDTAVWGDTTTQPTITDPFLPFP